MQDDVQNISPIKQRILYFIDMLDISKRDFYAKTGISRGTIESKTGITEDTITKFIAAYQNVSPVWLLTGVGDVYNAIPNCNPKTQPQSTIIAIPNAIPVPQDDFDSSDPKWNADFSDSDDDNKCLQCTEKERVIEALMTVIASKQDVIQAKEEIIRCKDDLINELSRKSKNATESPE